MKLHYYPDTDSPYIQFSPAPSTETRAITAMLNVDFAEDGSLVGVDIDRASAQFDLTTLETSALPIHALRAA